jgi:ABC-type nitrate/sulfonate/bicarbonate transport system substrate-binding protein
MAPPLTVPALVNGQVDLATVPVPAALSAARGAPLKLLALLSGTVQHTLVSRPQFSSIPELGGKKIGVSSLGDLMGYFGRVVIDKYQLKDTTLLAVPGTEQRLLAVQAGTVDAAIVSVPFNFRAEQLGLKRLSELRDVVRVPVSGLAVSEEKITKNRPEIVQFLKAVLDGVSLTLARREETIGVISSWMKLDPTTAARAYDAVKETYLRSGVPTQEQQQAFLDLIQYLGNLRNAPDPNTVFDFGPVREAGSVRQ